MSREQRDKDHAEGLAPAGTTFHINTRDIDSVGIVLIVGCALLAIAAAAFWITLSFLRRGPHKFQGHVFSFLAVWLLACNIAHTVIARTRSAGVSATLASGTPIPASIVAAGQRAAGISPVYWDQNYGKSPSSTRSCRVDQFDSSLLHDCSLGHVSDRSVCGGHVLPDFEGKEGREGVIFTKEMDDYVCQTSLRIAKMDVYGRARKFCEGNSRLR
jgi:hypothetical protein